MKTCFVAQPFDGDKFDLRYNDVFEPAIKNTGLEPYRVDKDPFVEIPIEEIESRIRAAEIVLVDITLDNPNVWYELGYAFACQKDVVIVCCSDERTGKFPFDIQHRSILRYKAGSTSNFKKLEHDITEKINALVTKAKKVATIIKTPINNVGGLESHEIALLLIIMEQQFSPIDYVLVDRLQQDMDRAGYNPIATSVGLRTLAKKNMIETFHSDEYGGQPTPACRIIETGDEWVINNQHLITFRKDNST